MQAQIVSASRLTESSYTVCKTSKSMHRIGEHSVEILGEMTTWCYEKTGVSCYGALIELCDSPPNTENPTCE